MQGDSNGLQSRLARGIFLQTYRVNRNLNVNSVRNPPAEEIEITPAMVEAGIDAIFGVRGVVDGIGFFSARDLAIEVYLAMRRRAIVEPRTTRQGDPTPIKKGDG
jgi:hypothetical protein